MEIKTTTELRLILADRIKTEPITKVTKSLGVAEVYLLQILSGKRDVSRKVAAKLGYEPVQQPKPERLFSPLKNKSQKKQKFA